MQKKQGYVVVLTETVRPADEQSVGRTLFPVDARVHLVVRVVGRSLRKEIIDLIRAVARAVGQRIEAHHLGADGIDQILRNHVTRRTADAYKCHPEAAQW